MISLTYGLRVLYEGHTNTPNVVGSFTALGRQIHGRIFALLIFFNGLAAQTVDEHSNYHNSDMWSRLKPTKVAREILTHGGTTCHLKGIFNMKPELNIRF
jgi:hypothetical protein